MWQARGELGDDDIGELASAIKVDESDGEVNPLRHHANFDDRATRHRLLVQHVRQHPVQPVPDYTISMPLPSSALENLPGTLFPFLQSSLELRFSFDSVAKWQSVELVIERSRVRVSPNVPLLVSRIIWNSL